MMDDSVKGPMGQTHEHLLEGGQMQQEALAHDYVAEHKEAERTAATVAKVAETLQVFVAKGSAEEYRKKSDHLAAIIGQVDPANARHLKQVIEILNGRVTKLEQILADVTEAVCGSPPQSA